MKREEEEEKNETRRKLKSIVFGVEMQQKLTNNWYWAKFAPHLTAFRWSVLMWWIYARVCRLFYSFGRYLHPIHIQFEVRVNKKILIPILWISSIERRRTTTKIVNIVDFWNASSSSQHITLFGCSRRWDSTGRQNYIDDSSCILLKQTTKISIFN